MKFIKLLWAFLMALGVALGIIFLGGLFALFAVYLELSPILAFGILCLVCFVILCTAMIYLTDDN